MTTLANQNGAGVAAQIAALTRRVAALEARPQQQSEQNSPNYLTVTAAGVVSVLFPGGVVMPEASGIPLVPSSALQWQDTGSVVREYVQGLSPAAGQHELDVIVQADAGTNPNNSAQITAHSEAANAQQTITIETTWGPGNSDPALIQIVSQDNALHRDFIRVQTKAGSRTIFDDLGQSSFLQLLTNTDVQIAMGSVTLTWPGGSTMSSMTTVNHGLDETPTEVLVSQTDGIQPGGAFAVGRAETIGATSFLAHAEALDGFAPANGNTSNFSWIAFG